MSDEDPRPLDGRADAPTRSLDSQLTPRPDAEGDEALREQPGELIGRYKLLQQIGEGGFGVVYMAEQEKPVRRKVALKIIKLGMDTKQVIARFEAERQALALMDHPNIARVLDAGATERGRPYFVMELVRGESITDYCDKNGLDIEDRLSLFQQTCHALQHAHQKGIIHRDIKPSNVMITLHDGQPIPKVIDFGVAKATNQRLTEKTLFTEYKQFVGTPDYMSPEQAEMSGLDIDTRTDVYSLGVLLYELLTGTTPFDTDSLREAGFSEMMRIIREDTPHKPSTRLRSLGETGDRTAERRRVDLRRLSTILSGDLDWIVMKCLEKDRTRRYETANGLALDIGRFLADQPVLAGPPSAGYKLRKFVKRHRAGTYSAAAMLLLLLIGIAGTGWGLLQAIEAREETQQRAAELETVMEFQQAILAEIDMKQMGQDIREALNAELDAESAIAADEAFQRVNMTNVARDVIEKNILARAVDAIEAQFGDEPRIEAALRQTIGDTYLELGFYPEALPQMELALDSRRRLLGADDPETLASVGNLGRLLRRMGRPEEAETYYREALEGRRRVLGDDHPDTLASINNMGAALQAVGDMAGAEVHFREAMERRRRVLGDDHIETLISINNVGFILKRMGKLDEAEPYYLEAVERGRRVLGSDHPDTLTWVSNVGVLIGAMGRREEAEPYYLEALEGRRRALGDLHPLTLLSYANLGRLLMQLDRPDEAETHLRRALAGRRRTLGDDHPKTLLSISDLGKSLEAIGRLDDAAAHHREAVGRSRRVLGEGDWGLGRALFYYGRTLMALEQYEDAEKTLVEAHGILHAAGGAQDVWTRVSVDALIEVFEASGDEQGADRWRAEKAGEDRR